MGNKRESKLTFWLFLAPVLFAFLMVIVIPFLMGVFYSFTNWSSSARAGNTMEFVGLTNLLSVGLIGWGLFKMLAK